jgi:hypothetical protein
VQAGGSQSLLGGNAYGPAGVTWTARESSRYWESVASSADGSRLVAVVYYGGQIYTSVGASLFAGASGTASGFQYLGNNVWQAIVEASAGSVAATNLTGTLTAAQIPNLDAAKIVSGTLGDARLSTNVPLLNGTNTFTGTNNFAGVTIASGKVGIGTNSPTTALDVVGAARVSGNLTIGAFPIITVTSSYLIKSAYLLAGVF